MLALLMIIRGKWTGILTLPVKVRIERWKVLTLSAIETVRELDMFILSVKGNVRR